jgi:hypothetical protein
MPRVPVDGRAQHNPVTVMLANYDLGRPPTAGVEQVTLDGRWILANSWPAPPPVPGRASGGMSAASAPVAPRTAAAALWPNLARGGER